MVNNIMGKISSINFIIISSFLLHIWQGYITDEIETSTIVRSILTILILLGLSKRSNLARWIYIILIGITLALLGSYLIQQYFSINILVMSSIYSSHVLILLFHKETVLKFTNQEDENKVEIRKEGNPNKEFLYLGLICSGIFFYGLSSSVGSGNNFTFIVGQSTTLSAILYLAYLFLFGKNLSIRQKFYTFIIVFTSVIITSYIIYERSLTQLQDEAIVFKSHIDSISNQANADGNNFRSEQDGAGLYEVLDGARIQADSGLEETTLILNNLNLLVDKHEKINSERIEGIKNKVQALNISEFSKKEMEIGIDISMPGALEMARKYWNLERERLSILENQVKFVASIRPYWTIEDDQFIFPSTKNVEIFNAFLDEIEGIDEQQLLIQETRSQKINDSLN